MIQSNLLLVISAVVGRRLRKKQPGVPHLPHNALRIASRRRSQQVSVETLGCLQISDTENEMIDELRERVVHKLGPARFGITNLLLADFPENITKTRAISAGTRRQACRRVPVSLALPTGRIPFPCPIPPYPFPFRPFPFRFPFSVFPKKGLFNRSPRMGSQIPISYKNPIPSHA